MFQILTDLLLNFKPFSMLYFLCFSANILLFLQSDLNLGIYFNPIIYNAVNNHAFSFVLNPLFSIFADVHVACTVILNRIKKK